MSTSGVQSSEMYLRYYKPSGKMAPKALLTMSLCGAIAGAVLGAAYAYLTHWIPFIYIEFFLTLGFGAGVGLGVGLGARWGLCRKPSMIYLFAILAGVIGVYASWVFHLHILGGVWVYEPSQLLMVIGRLSESYSISIGRFSSSGTSITGKGLIVLWSLEALAIIGTSAAVAGMGFASSGFCERCERWVEKLDRSPIEFTPFDPQQLKDAVGQRDLAYIRSLEMAPSNKESRCTMTVEQCPRCRNMFLLSCTVNTVTKDKKGNATTATKQAFRNLIVEQDVVDALREKQAAEPAATS